MKVSIEKMVQGGVGFTRLPDGRVCFVPQALAGEDVDVVISKENKDYVEARVTQILSPSPLRIKPFCPLYEQCGGCSLQHVSLDSQVQIMKDIVKDTFLRIGKTILPEDFPIYHSQPWHYRHRARVFKNKEKKYFGFRAEHSHQIIPFEECPVLTSSLNHFLHLATTKKIPTPELHCFDNGNDHISYFYKGMKEADQRILSDNQVQIGGRVLSMDASVFFQSNLSLLSTLVERVRIHAGKGDWLIDLFSGVGFFASLLEEQFSRITTVEREPGCLRHAKKNLKKTAEQVTANAESWLQANTKSSPAVLIVDPPRTGLPSDALKVIGEGQIKKMIYVSCNPVTLARDLFQLKQSGFDLKIIEGFAFYPHTPHLEMLLVLERG